MAARSSSTKVFKDPIHGSIELDPLLVKIIDTPEFQRLRKIKQLGGGCYVYPGAVHTRFDHSIGVCHIAGEFIERLQQQYKDDEKISDKDVLCVKIAALCHDLGHGPFSHLYDKLLSECPKELFANPSLREHEYRSVEMFKHLCKKKELESAFEERKLDENDIRFIEALITFVKKYEEVDKQLQKDTKSKEIDPERVMESLLEDWEDSEMGRPKKSAFLFEIVANGFTGIDVDKMDYFARDSHGLGLPNRFDWRRYIQTSELREKKKVFRIATREKSQHNLCELFHTRYVLYRTAYKHKTIMIVENRIGKALKEASEAIKFKGKDGKFCNLFECAGDMEAFTRLNDSVLDLIMLSSGDESKLSEEESHASKEESRVVKLPFARIHFTEGLKEAGRYLCEIDKRALPKFVGKKTTGSYSETEAMFEDVKKELHEQFEVSLDDMEQLEYLHAKFTSKEEEKCSNLVFFSKHGEKFDEEFPIKGDEMLKHLPGSTVQSEMFLYYCGDHKNIEKITRSISQLKMPKDENDEASESGQSRHTHEAK